MYHIQDFVQLIAQLRNPNGGCPWDLKQTYQSMIPCLTEETYEVIEAIEKQNMTNLKEELGDLLLQVVFFSQLACEDGHFAFNDVVNEVAEKIIRRHPHVFGEKSANNEQEALQNWNAIKEQEKHKAGNHSILDDVPNAFPALMRAEKLQKRCAKVGFDWTDIQPVFAKVEEELNEVRQELTPTNISQEKIQAEIGDLLFSVVNLARHLKVSPEEALRQANNKFEQRFRKLENQLQAQNLSINDRTLTELDHIWDQIKQEEILR